MSVIENMSDADVLALSKAVIATISEDLASHPPLTEEDLAAAKEKRDDFEEKLLAHDRAQAAAAIYHLAMRDEMLPRYKPSEMPPQPVPLALPPPIRQK